MKRFLIGTAILGLLGAGSAWATTAAAAPLGGTSADQTVNQLKADGYNVQLNLDGIRDVPLSECTVTGVHGIPNTAPVTGQPTTQFTTVYVDVNCPPDN
ncbi:MAG: hypothetical protein JO152_05080 [Mycobacteriaceae bacterium]|nr:hypothetical protein [Mycobacteriaceae bacterium]